MTATETPVEPDLIEQLTRDIRSTLTASSPQEASNLVRTYYDVQKVRLELGNRVWAVSADGREANRRSREALQGAEVETSEEPQSAFSVYLSRQLKMVEDRIASAMGIWIKRQPGADWTLGTTGIGPVLAAGLHSTLDATRASHASSIWSFCGLDPTASWEKGQVRPWSAFAKVLTWKIADQFVRHSGRESCVYGHLYLQRKAFEVERDANGGCAEVAAQTLTSRTFKDAATKAIYESGHLPPGRLDLRARRYAVKRFLADWWVVQRELLDLPTGEPYAVAVLGHAHAQGPLQ